MPSKELPQPPRLDQSVIDNPLRDTVIFDDSPLYGNDLAFYFDGKDYLERRGFREIVGTREIRKSGDIVAYARNKHIYHDWNLGLEDRRKWPLIFNIGILAEDGQVVCRKRNGEIWEHPINDFEDPHIDQSTIQIHIFRHKSKMPAEKLPKRKYTKRGTKKP